MYTCLAEFPCPSRITWKTGFIYVTWILTTVAGTEVWTGTAMITMAFPSLTVRYVGSF